MAFDWKCGMCYAFAHLPFQGFCFSQVLCCGLEGPRSYMDYLQGVPTHCYHPDLVTQGCSDFVKNIVMPIQQISHLQLRLAIFVELVILLILAATLLKKCISLIGERKHKRVITHGLAVLIDLVKNTFWNISLINPNQILLHYALPCNHSWVLNAVSCDVCIVLIYATVLHTICRWQIEMEQRNKLK